MNWTISQLLKLEENGEIYATLILLSFSHLYLHNHAVKSSKHSYELLHFVNFLLLLYSIFKVLTFITSFIINSWKLFLWLYLYTTVNNHCYNIVHSDTGVITFYNLLLKLLAYDPCETLVVIRQLCVLKMSPLCFWSVYILVEIGRSRDYIDISISWDLINRFQFIFTPSIHFMKL